MSKVGSKTLDDLLVSGGSGELRNNRQAATVGGDQVVTKEEKGEIYVRADGKKVRRVVKKVIKKKPKAPEPEQGTIDDDDASLVSYMSQGVKKKKKKEKKSLSSVLNQTPQRVTDDDDASLVSYMSQGVKKKKKKSKKASSSSAVSEASMIAASAEAALDSIANDNDDDGSVVSYMSASGTKRKTKKSKKKLPSAAAAIAAEAEAASAEAAIADDDDTSVVSYISASGAKRKKKKSKKKEASAAEAIAFEAEGAAKSSAIEDDDQSLVSYMSASGIKRKKKKDKSKKALDGFLSRGLESSKGSGSSVTSKKKKDDESVRSKTSKKLKAEKKELEKKAAKDGEVVSEIYINADGKKVRRVRKVKPKSTDDIPNSLSGLLDHGSTAKVGPATVAGDRVSETSEIYINKDGKKVRRVVKKITKVNTSNDTGSSGELANMSDAGDDKVKGAATVSGGEGEIYINKDGKKVRRVKKSTPTGLDNLLSAGDKMTGAATVSGEGEIYINADGKKVRRVVKKTGLVGAASVGAAPQGNDDFEIYINKDGKKVKRIRKNVVPSESNSAEDAKAAAKDIGGLDDLLAGNKTPKIVGAATVAAPTSTVKSEVYINKDGKKVRRVVTQTSSERGNLDKLLDATPVSKPGASGGLTVGGDRPTKSASSEEGEIYIRADGKKVRRVPKKKPLSTPTNATGVSLEGYLVGDELAQPKLVNSATVAGDKMSTKLDGGEIIIRADGKKVIRRPKNKDQETEVYRRADGKLVRRVKKESKIAEKEQSSIQLSDEEEKIATEYRKLKNMGLPNDAVRHKMKVSDVHPKIIAAVLGEQWTEPSSIEPPPPLSTVNHLNTNVELTGGEEALAIQYLKLKSLGLPDDAVRQKMITQSVDPKIIAAVFGDAWPPEIDKTKSSTDILGKKQSGPVVLTSKENVSPSEIKPNVVLSTAPTPSIMQRSQSNRVLLIENATPGHVQALESSKPTEVASIESSKSAAPSPLPVLNRVPEEQTPPASEEPSKLVSSNSAPTSVSSTSHVLFIETSDKDVAADNQIRPTETAMETRKPTSAQEVKKVSSVIPLTAQSTSVVPIGIILNSEEEAVAEQYRKMLKMGLPNEVVRHKMSAMEIDKKIMASVLGEELSSESQTQPIVLKTATSAHLKLSDEEEATAESFRKMLKMGLPNELVRQKMTSVDVHPRIVASVFGEDWSYESADPNKVQVAKPSTPIQVAEPSTPTTNSVNLSAEDEATATQFRKMLKMGLPNDVVRHKMMSVDVPSKIMASVLGEPWSEPKQTPVQQPPAVQSPPAKAIQLSNEEEAEAAQFSKMLKMGLPPDVVRHKMSTMDTHPKIVAFVLGEEWYDESQSQPTTSIQPTAASADVSVQLTADEEAIAAQYRKMKKMGLPNDVVRHKMISMEVAPKIIAAVLEEPWSEPPSSLTSLPAGVSKAAASAVAVESSGQNAAYEATIPSKLLPMESAIATSAPIGSMAFIVVVGDDPLVQQQAAAAKALGDEIVLNPDEKFAVKVADGQQGSSANPPKTKFITLAELAKMSGQSQSELESIVRERRQRSASPPRFVLQSLVEEKYEVEIPENVASGNASSAAANAPKGVVGGTIIKEGEEVVDSALANAARAVSALGASDMAALLEKIRAGDMAELLNKLREAEKRQKKLEKQLMQAGVAIAEDIDYAVAKNKVNEIAKRMNEIGGSDVVHPDKEEQNRLREEYFKLEQEMERYNTALTLSEEYLAEQERLAKKWEEDNEPDNIAALKAIRRHMPVMIRHMSEADLVASGLPKNLAKKFKRTNVLQCLRINPADLERMHPVSLENMRVTGLTLTERRAVYHHLKSLGPKWEKNKAEKMTERKWVWYKMMKDNFKESVEPFLRHCAQYGPPNNHPYATRDNPGVGCPLMGKQCPVRADKEYDYSGNYGYPDGDEYEVSEVKKSDVDDPGAKAKAEAAELARSKKANERADILKKHYNGKLLQVSKANGSCENMDEAMDRMERHTLKWIEFAIDKGKDETEADKKKEIANFTEALNELKLTSLDFATRSGMQMSGKKKDGGDAPDIRSSVEAALSEETYECMLEFFVYINDRMKEIAMVDTRVEKAMDMLAKMWKELHEKNLALIAALGAKIGKRSRPLKKNSDLRKEVEDKQKPEDAAAPAAQQSDAPRGPPLPMGGGGRGGLLDAIGGRGRGRGDGGGRGGLLDAIAGKGKGGGGGRGGLLDAIAGRGKGKGDGGGRGGLLDAIAGRGKGKGGGDGGGRGGLLAAIAARGGG